MRDLRGAAGLAAASLLLVYAAPVALAAAGDDGPPVGATGLAVDGRAFVTALRAPEPPQIDGHLDEAAWTRAPVIRELRQIEPEEGAPASERSEVRVLYDRDFVYFAVRAFDREPERIVAQELGRDRGLDGDDHVALTVDTFHDRRNAYMFAINPRGSRWDALISNNGRPQDEWDGIWYGKARIDGDGWTAELAIPTKTLSFNPEGDTWGFNLMRAIRRRNEVVRWAAVNQNLRFSNMAEAGAIRGLVGLEQGLGLDVKPGVSLKSKLDRREDRETLELDPTLDVFYKFTPSLTGVVTVNSEFGEAEVDERRVNLTRFPLFFPEKRAFFLQDAGIFSFGSLRGNGQPFDSRRIGLGPSSELIDIRVGSKLTGRLGPFNLGALHARTGHEGEFEAKNLGVARLEVNALEESRFGAIATVGDPHSDVDNALAGVDFHYRRSDFLGDKSVFATVWAQRSATTGLRGDSSAWGVSAGFPNDRIGFFFLFRELEENFNPALGFVSRVDVRRMFSELRYRIRPEGPLRTVDFTVRGNVVTDRGGNLDTLFASVQPFALETEAGDEFALEYIVREERLEDSFEISDDVVIPLDDYRFERYRVRLETADWRPVAGRIELEWGEFFSGDRFSSELELAWRPSSRYLVSIDYEQNDVRLPEGDFTTRLARLRLNLNFTPDLSWSSLLQYDNVTDTASLNSRLRWIIEPGRELFLVFNPELDVEGSRLHSARTDTVVKLGWTFRY